MKTENVEFLWDSEIIALLHNEKLTGIQIRNVKTGEESTLACDGVWGADQGAACHPLSE